MLPGCLYIIGIGKPVIVVVIPNRFPRRSEKRDQYFRAVHPTPAKRVMWKAVELAPVNGGRCEIFHAAFLHELRDHPRKTKCIRHPQHLTIQPKLPADEALPE